jgi:hypothetical protein
MSMIEQLREEAVQDLCRIEAFKAAWPERSSFLASKLPPKDEVVRASVLRLGDSLSPAFKLVGKGDRSQGGISSGGAVWEAIVVWYLNLCLAGTRAVCVRGGSLCPKPIKDALSIVHESNILRSEPDVLIISSKDLQTAPRVSSRRELISASNAIAEKSFHSLGLINIQCKTNWNDNAQIPMLWNMLYNQARKGATIPNGFTVGCNGFSLSSIGHFGYAFATVPTQSKGPAGYKATTVEVLRVKSMTAGNYWGYPTRNSVCSSLSEIFQFFTRNGTVFPAIADVAKHTADAIQSGGSANFNIDRLLFPT